jgi:hypothetical protein
LAQPVLLQITSNVDVVPNSKEGQATGPQRGSTDQHPTGPTHLWNASTAARANPTHPECRIGGRQSTSTGILALGRAPRRRSTWVFDDD